MLLQTEPTMRRIPKFYELTPEDRPTRRLWAQRIAILYGTIALVAFAALAVGSHQSPSNQSAALTSRARGDAQPQPLEILMPDLNPSAARPGRPSAIDSAAVHIDVRTNRQEPRGTR